MPTNPVSPDVFPRLREILHAVSSNYVATSDTPDNYSLNARNLIYKKKPVFFAAVQRKKNYITLHLMPLYMNPIMQAKVPPELKKRMQGKACFNFTAVDQECFAELARLTAAGLKIFNSEKFRQTIQKMQ